MPSHPLRKGDLNQAAYSLFLFIRDVCDGDLVGWIDQRLAGADEPGAPDRAARMREAVLEPLTHVHGVSRKVWLDGPCRPAARGRPGSGTLGYDRCGMIAVDTLVHNFLHRTGTFRRFAADHAYGPGCYAAGGCAQIIEGLAHRVDAREFNPVFPAYFPRLIQFAIWRFCAESGLSVCNGRRIDDRARCENRYCPAFGGCDRIALRAALA